MRGKTLSIFMAALLFLVAVGCNSENKKIVKNDDEQKKNDKKDVANDNKPSDKPADKPAVKPKDNDTKPPVASGKSIDLLA